jgi:hypothetical protein
VASGSSEPEATNHHKGSVPYSPLILLDSRLDSGNLCDCMSNVACGIQTEEIVETPEYVLFGWIFGGTEV